MNSLTLKQIIEIISQNKKSQYTESLDIKNGDKLNISITIDNKNNKFNAIIYNQRSGKFIKDINLINFYNQLNICYSYNELT